MASPRPPAIASEHGGARVGGGATVPPNVGAAASASAAIAGTAGPGVGFSGSPSFAANTSEAPRMGTGSGAGTLNGEAGRRPPKAPNGSHNNPSSLLAVLLVTSSSRGSHLVFRWPRKPRVLKRHSRVRYYAAQGYEGEHAAARGLLHRKTNVATAAPSQAGPGASAAALGKNGAAERGRERPTAHPMTFSTVRDRAAAVRGVDVSMPNAGAASGRGAVLDSLGIENIDMSHFEGGYDGADDDEHPTGFWSDDQGSITSPSESSVTSSSDDDLDDSNTGVEDSASMPGGAPGTDGRRTRHSSMVASHPQFGAGSTARRLSRSTTGRNSSSRPPPSTSARRRQGNDIASSSSVGLQLGTSGTSESGMSSVTAALAGAADLGIAAADRRESDAGNSDVGGASSHANTHEGTEMLGASAKDRNIRAHKTYLGYDCDFLASLLSPKPDLCHQKMEMVIDDLAFVGHPVYLGDQPQNSDEEDDGGDEFDRRGRQGPRSRTDTQHSQESNAGAKSKSAANSSNSAYKLDLFHLVLVLDRPDPSAALPSMDLSSYIQFFYDNVVFKLTAALYAEQKRANYVAQEADKLISLRERCMDDGQSLSAFNTQCLGLSSLARTIKEVYQSLSSSSDALVTVNDNIEAHLQLPPIMRSSSLLIKATDVATDIDPLDPVFLSGGGFAGLGKDSSLLARLMALDPEELLYEEWTRTTGPYLLPWKTLLLMGDVDSNPFPDNSQEGYQEGFGYDGFGGRGGLSPFRRESVATLTGSAGVGVWAKKFVNLLQPTLSGIPTFAELADLLEWDLYEDVYPMVRHLIYYREAKVIDVPRLRNTYAISPFLEVADLEMLNEEWMQSFPELPQLPAFLATLSQSFQPFSKHPALQESLTSKQTALQALIWLLRADIIVQVHVRLRLIARTEIKQIWRERKVIARKERKRAQSENQHSKESSSSQKADSDANSDMRPESRASAASKEQRGRTRERSRSADARANKTPMKPDFAGGKDRRSRASTLSQKNPDVEELRFEKRPVLRSRSPSKLFADLLGREDKASGSRSNTPRGRRRYTSAVDKPVIGSYGTVYSEPEVRATGRSTNRTSSRPAARSPSKARMTIKGFGADEQRAFDDSDAGSPASNIQNLSTSAAGRDDTGVRNPVESIDEQEEDLEELDAESEEGWEHESMEATLIAEPSRASKEEDEWIAIMIEEKDEWLSEQFYRLLPYLNGKHTLDEIAYREEMRRRDLRAVVEAFRADLITFVHP